MNVIKGFFKKEIIAMLRSPVLMVAILIMPVVQMILLSGAITFQATNLRLVMQNAPNDTVMEQIYNRAIGTGFFVPANVGNRSPIDAVQGGVADVAIIAPQAGLTTDLVRGDAEIQILIDSMNILKAHSIESYLRGIIMQVLLEYKQEKAKPQINFDVRVLFNPQLNTKFFMVPSMVAILVFLALLILISVSIAKEKETGTMETLISAPISKYDIVLGKVLPYVVVSFVVMLSIVVVGMIVFRVPYVLAVIFSVLCACVWNRGLVGNICAYSATGFARVNYCCFLGIDVIWGDYINGKYAPCIALDKLYKSIKSLFISGSKYNAKRGRLVVFLEKCGRNDWGGGCDMVCGTTTV